MDTLWLGLIGWIGVGIIAASLARPLLPGAPPLSWPAALGTGIAGGVAGGLVATWLGFGGLAGFDGRAAAFACLCSMIGLLILRSATLADES